MELGCVVTLGGAGFAATCIRRQFRTPCNAKVPSPRVRIAVTSMAKSFLPIWTRSGRFLDLNLWLSKTPENLHRRCRDVCSWNGLPPFGERGGRP